MSRSGSLGAIPAGAARRRRRFSSVIGAWPRAFGAFEVGIYERRREYAMRRRISTGDEPRSLRSAAGHLRSATTLEGAAKYWPQTISLGPVSLTRHIHRAILRGSRWPALVRTARGCLEGA